MAEELGNRLERGDEGTIEPSGFIRYDPEDSGSFLKGIPLRERGANEKVVNNF